MASDNQEIISSDLPLNDPADDKLGYAPFAQGLARAVQQMSSPQGYVIAINGAWGLGKTTIVSFIQYYLRQEAPEQQPLIVEFAPWMFSGHENLIHTFCEQLLATMNNHQSWRAVVKKITQPINNLAERLSEAPAVGPYAKVVKAFGNKPDAQTLKTIIAGELGKHNRRVLVVVDDIDRLTADEVQQLFRVIKAVANFPNVIYLVVFDKEIVANALSSTAVSGAAYLEKIVHASFDIPQPNRTKLREMFFRKLNALIRDLPGERFDEGYWTNVYLSGIDHFLMTPRHINRLLNVLDVTYPMVQEEVNPVDFIALEALRLFCPEIYRIVANNKDEFAGLTYPDSGRDYDAEPRKAFHNAWLQQINEHDREPVKKMLTYLFPRLDGVFRNHYYGVNFELSWRKNYRVCSDL